jgi:hypothetical protein
LWLDADEDDTDDEWPDWVSEEPDMVTRRFMISRKVGRMVGSTCQQSATSWAYSGGASSGI